MGTVIQLFPEPTQDWGDPRACSLADLCGNDHEDITLGTAEGVEVNEAGTGLPETRRVIQLVLCRACAARLDLPVGGSEVSGE